MRYGLDSVIGQLIYDDNGNVRGEINALTKREWFAGLAMQGLIANSAVDAKWSSCAEWAVISADALIEALNKETK